MHLDDQCMWVFKTRAGNLMLLSFVNIKRDSDFFDREDDIYECINLSTEKRHLITCRDFNKYFETGHFFELRKTKLYKEHEFELVKKSLLKLILHVNTENI